MTRHLLVEAILDAGARMLNQIKPTQAQVPPDVSLFAGQRTNKRRNVERAEMRAVGGRRQWLKLRKAARRAEKEQVK